MAAGASVGGDYHHRMANSAILGRDVSGPEQGSSGLLVPKRRSIDGGDAAYDMKSLGRHIEAVSPLLLMRNLGSIRGFFLDWAHMLSFFFLFLCLQ
jgi:hypothetical protein